ncbi:MAG: hypothetical protein CFE21_10525 [Bacteroidetes bacterium B1(2017)]|nr:MAG: hypothetical protein CFE21_10525 [Bacteroidetes bacterium B1(2017)]
MKQFILLLSLAWCFSLTTQAQCGNFSQYYANFTISNPNASPLGARSYRLVLNTQTLIGSGQMQSTGVDIKVGTSCCNLFSFWVDSSTLNTSSTIIWVRIPSIPASTIFNVKVFYGGASLGSNSNLAATFPSRYVLSSGIDSLQGPLYYDWFEVKAGATVYVKQATTLDIYADKIVVKGNINGFGKGHKGPKNTNCTPGAGPGGGLVGSPCTNGGAGAYGGNAGCTPGSGASSCNVSGALAYGTYNGFDIEPGSSGSTGSMGFTNVDGAGNGGGAVSLNANELLVSGIINMNGQDGLASASSNNSGGGGSGGGILLNGAYLNLQGASLLAMGGKASNAYNATGGGGRIKVFKKVSLTGAYTYSVASTNQHIFGGAVQLLGAVGGVGTFYVDSPNTYFYVSTFTGNGAQNCGTAYFSKAIGALNDVSTWGSNTNGTGTSPIDFTSANVSYYLHNQSAPSISANWNISGANSLLVIGNGTTASALNLPYLKGISVDSMYVNPASSINVYGSLTVAKAGFASTSSINYLDTAANQTLLAGIYGNMQVNYGPKLLLGNVQVNGTFSLYTDVTCNGYTLTLGSSASQAGVLNRAGGSILGAFARWIPQTGATGTAGLFPIKVGANNKLLQLDYSSAPSAGGLVKVEFVPSNPGSLGLPVLDNTLTPTINLTRTSNDGFWRMQVLSGLTGGVHAITVFPSGMAGVSSLAQLRLLKRSTSSAAWAMGGNSVVGSGSLLSPVIKRTGFTSLAGEVCVASDSTINALPVSLLSWYGFKEQEQAHLIWRTGSEQNSLRFELEKSVVKGVWQQIGSLKAKGISNVVQTYSFIEENAFLGSAQNTYRLKQIDQDGSFSYSNEIVLGNTQEPDFRVYPNPFTQELFIDAQTEENELKISLYTLQGHLIKQEKLVLSNGQARVLTQDLEAGLYILQLESHTSTSYWKIKKE